MDKSIVAIEESQFKSNSVASCSKSTGLVKINSIEIDLNRAAEEEMETPNVHEHFSMRGFVAGMRKKDVTVCYPFSTSQTAGVVSLEETLPPLHTPSFRWWQCSNCVPDIAVERDRLAMVVAERIDDAVALASENRGKDGLPSLKDIGNEKSDCQNGRADTSRAKLFHNNTRNHDSADGSHMLTIAELPFSKVNESVNASSPSDGTVNVLPRRRKPKLRSLADIIMEERNPPMENRRPKSASSSGLQTTSTDSEIPLRNSKIAQGIKTPQAKRKFVFEEEGSEGKLYPRVSVKRFKGQTPEVEGTSRRTESPNLESRVADALAQTNVEHWSKSVSTNGRKRKSIDVGKKVRQNQTGNGKVAHTESPKVNLTGSGIFKKHDVSDGPNFRRPRGTAPSLKNSSSEKQLETDFGLSKSKRPENEASRNPLIPPRKSNLGDISDKGKASLDLLVNSFASYERHSSSRPDRDIPDLNETFTHNTSVTRGNQLPTHSQNVPVNKNLDISASCSKETIREGKRPVSDQQMAHKTSNNEPGVSEMEIVELLAKNKLENSRKRLWPDHGINSSVPLPNGRYPVPRPILPFPTLPNRNAQEVRNVNHRVDKTYPPSFPHQNKSQLDLGKLENNRFSLFRPFNPNQSFSQQKKTLYLSSSSQMSMPSGRPELVWPPRQPNAPFHLTVPQNHNHPFQANSAMLPSFSNGSHKGKTVSDIKDHEEKRSVNGPFMLKERLPNPTSVGGLDPYSNDAIPAMQLLSLMDQRISSSSSLKIGPPKSFMTKTFAPCNNHPPVNRIENQNVFNGLFVTQNGHYKDLLESCYGVTPGGKNISHFLHRPIPYEQGSARGVQMAGPSNVAIEKARSKSPPRVCTLNRNPADFSIPDERNEFTISSKDLKFRKKSDAKGKSPFVSVGGQRKQRARKDAAGRVPS